MLSLHRLPEKDVNAVVNAFIDIIRTHSEFGSELLSLQSELGKDQRIGGAFMAFAEKIKEVCKTSFQTDQLINTFINRFT